MKKYLFYFKMINWAIAAIFILLIILLQNQSILFCMLFVLANRVGEYGKDASIRCWPLIQENGAEGFDFGNVMRYYRMMGILFGALFLLTLLFPFSNITVMISFVLNLIVLYMSVYIRKEMRSWSAAVS